LSYEQIIEERRIITAAFNWEGKNKIYDFSWDKNREDAKLVEDLTGEMNEADEIVAHYGDGFDVPWVRTRAMKHSIVVPNWKSVDTKAWASRYFFLNSNKLDYLAKFLGIGTKIRTEYDLWKQATGGTDKQSKAAVRRMCAYNRHDTALLKPVHTILSKYCPLHTHAGVQDGGERWSCQRCGSEHVGHIRMMVGRTGVTKHQMRCLDSGCGKYYMIPNVAFKAYEERNV
jgi:uncharacterized protein YprB with RNaseH-like and TPR domain